MPKIKHLLLTRYNVASPGKWEEIRLREGWLEKRFDLFRDYCVPGVASQTNKDFEWLIFFDEQTPVEYMKRIEAFQTQFPFRIIYTSVFELKDLCAQIVAEKGDCDWLLTTRLDSDDVLAVDFMARLKNGLVADQAKALNFPNGLILSQKNEKTALYKDRDISSPFISLLEPLDENLHTVWSKMHRHVDELAPLSQIDEAPAWMQVVHGDNIANHVRGVRVPLSAHVEKYPILNMFLKNSGETAQDILIENLILTPVRQTKEAGINVIKKLIGRR